MLFFVFFKLFQGAATKDLQTNWNEAVIQTDQLAHQPMLSTILGLQSLLNASIIKFTHAVHEIESYNVDDEEEISRINVGYFKNHKLNEQLDLAENYATANALENKA